MEIFSHILLFNLLPLTVMVGIGVILQKSFQLDIRTLSKLNFYLFSPGLMFIMLYESNLTLAVFFQVLLFFCVFYAGLIGIVEIVLRVRGYRPGMRGAMRNSVLFYNSANYGIPLNQLVFVNDPFTLSIQIIIFIIMTVIPNTYGIYSVNAHRQKLKETMRTIASMPVIYIIPIVFFLRVFDISVPMPLYTPIKYVANAFIATALVTLGVQLGSMNWRIKLSDVAISNVLRLCISPALGYVVTLLLGIKGVMAQALVLSCAVPTSLSSVLLAVEFDNEPEFSSQAVFSSTVFSIVTVTIVIYLMKFIH